MTTPPYQAATSGFPPRAAQVNQFLGSHAVAYLYTGTQQGGHTNLGSGSASTNGLYLAQQFTAGSSFSLGRMVLYLALTGAPGTTTVSIQTSSGGAPSGTVLASTVLPPAMVPGSAAAVSIPLPCSLTSGTGYWIVVAAAGDASDYYAWSKSDQASGASTSTNGSAWTAQAYGFAYSYWDQSAVPPLVHTYDDTGARWTTESSSTGQLTALQEYTVGQSAASPATSSVALSYSGSSLTSVAPVGSTPVAPTWSAPHNGIIGDASATAAAGQVNQFLGTHPEAVIYQGASILTPNGTGVSAWAISLGTEDVDQPFTLSGTAVGRVQIPLLPVGTGADLLVSLCADNSGAPGTVITQTRIPASWIYQLAAVSGLPGPDSATTQATNNPLAVAQFNTLAVGPYSTNPYSPPATGSANIINPAITASGNYLINLGGANQDTDANVASAFIASATATGLGPLIPQPLLPQTNWTGCTAATSDTLILAGGLVNATDTSPTSAVFTASWNPVTGALGSWSAQQALPQGVQYAGIASYGETVYVLGGQNASGSLNSVYWATVSNGQITAWNTAAPLPQQLNSVAAVAVNGFVFVIGGENSGGQSTAVWYAAIDADGSLGRWIPGPAVPAAVINGGNQIAASAQAILTAGNSTYALGVTSAGPGAVWNQQNDIQITSEPEWALIPGNGADYQLICADPIAGRSRTAGVYQTPVISVPLPASGLTNSATYHILLQQQGGDVNNYLRTHKDAAVFTGNPTLQTSPRAAYVWTAASPAGTAVPVQVFDQTVVPGQFPLHLWSDNGARMTTIVSATTPDQRILGFCEATRQAVALNATQGFETGLSPWTWSGGSAVQSDAEVFEGRYAAQVTPSGSDSTVYLESELLPCMPGQSITVDGRMWFTSAVTSDASMSVNWYDLTGTYLSTSSSNVSVAAATWTQLSNAFTAPAGAYGFTICPALSGTPASAQVFYVDAAYGYPTYTGPQASTVTQIQYDGTWPAPTQGTGSVQLA